jgi:hypothetical protein
MLFKCLAGFWPLKSHKICAVASCKKAWLVVKYLNNGGILPFVAAAQKKYEKTPCERV